MHTVKPINRQTAGRKLKRGRKKGKNQRFKTRYNVRSLDLGSIFFYLSENNVYETQTLKFRQKDLTVLRLFRWKPEIKHDSCQKPQQSSTRINSLFSPVYESSKVCFSVNMYTTSSNLIPLVLISDCCDDQNPRVDTFLKIL